MRPEEDPDAQWVRALSGRSEGSSRDAIAEARSARGLYRHLAAEHRAEGRRSYIEIDAPLELHALTRLLRPRHVVEVGVSSGVSSAYILHALDQNGAGTLHSIDLPSYPRARKAGAKTAGASWTLPPGREPGWAVPRGLVGGWDLRLGDKAELLPGLSKELPSVDLFVYDVPHEDRETRAEFALYRRLLPPSGVAISDHGPGGGLCGALDAWARSVGGRATRRRGLGLFGFRHPVNPRRRSRQPRVGRRAAR